MDKRSLMAVFVSIALLCAACGGSDEPTAAPTALPAPTNTVAPPTNTSLPQPTATKPPAVASQPISPIASITETVPVSAQLPITTNQSITPTQPVSGSNASGQAYPAPVAAPAQQKNAPYPPPSSNKAQGDAYPSPVTPTPEKVGNVPVTPFVLQIPITTSATLVQGSGPPNVPILIADISFMGDILGKGVIGKDGKFAVKVTPMEKGHWVGVALDELKGTQFSFDDFQARGFRGPGAEQVPQVGFVFDSLYVGDTGRR